MQEAQLYQKRKYRLVWDNACVTLLCASAVWGFAPYKVRLAVAIFLVYEHNTGVATHAASSALSLTQTAVSYGFGGLLGTLYLLLLGR